MTAGEDAGVARPDGDVLAIPPGTLVVLVGASGSGKSTLLRRFPPQAIISSDAIRHELHGDESDHSAEARVWRLVYERLHDRLGRGYTTVLDSTAASPRARRAAAQAARLHSAPLLFLALATPLDLALARNRARNDPRRGEPVPEEVTRAQSAQVRAFLRTAARDWPGRVVELGPEAQARLAFDAPLMPVPRIRPPLPTEALRGPFAVIGDVHGCWAELRALIRRPELVGRLLVFVGDLVGLGPDTLGVLRLVQRLAEAGLAVCARGDLDDALARALPPLLAEPGAADGQPRRATRGLGPTLAEIERFRRGRPAAAARRLPAALAFLRGLPYHLVLDGGRLVVSHAGIPRHLVRAEGPHLRRFALYGARAPADPPAALLAVDRDALHVHGHTPVAAPPAPADGARNLDTGCVFGGALSALLYPELAVVSVPAARAYAARAPGR